MKNIVLFALMLAIIPATSVVASEPPAYAPYQAGWGMNPHKWQTTTGSFSAWGIYDNGSSGGAGWVVGYDGSYNPIYIDYADITFELWIEMYALQTYRYTSYQWHRLGNEAEHICFVIQGTVQSNSGQYISLIADGTDPLTHLVFREDIFGRTGAPYGYDIPISWMGRWGRGLVYGNNVVQIWTAYTPDPDIDMLIDESCDHWFEFEGCFDLEYHVDDGYYSLTSSGCPSPLM